MSITIACDDLDHELPKLKPVQAATLSALAVVETLERLHLCAHFSAKPRTAKGMRSAGVKWCARLPSDIDRLHRWLQTEAWKLLELANTHPVEVGGECWGSYADAIYHHAGNLCTTLAFITEGRKLTEHANPMPQLSAANLQKHWKEVAKYMAGDEPDFGKLRAHLRKELQRATGDAQQMAIKTAPPTFSKADLRNLIGLGDTAITKYTKEAGVEVPAQSVKNHRYNCGELQKLLPVIINKSQKNLVRNNCRKLIRELEKYTL